MRLVKIKNKYLFKSGNPNGTHTYAAYYDKKNKRYNAVQLTHLYVKDKKRFEQVKQGMLMVAKFKEFDVPSGVKNSYFYKNVTGGKIDLKDKNNVRLVSTRNLSKKQSEKIRLFAKKKHK